MDDTSPLIFERSQGMKKITVKLLKSINACTSGIELFAKLYPKGFDPNRMTFEVFLELLESPLKQYVGWAYLMQLIPYWSLRKVNLSGKNLRGVDLRYADLRYANLRETDLSHANLYYANLGNVNLRYANLSYTNLDYSNLRCADLGYSKMHYTSLSEADLSWANLKHAKLKHTYLKGAELTGTLCLSDRVYTEPIDEPPL